MHRSNKIYFPGGSDSKESARNVSLLPLLIRNVIFIFEGFPGGSVVKNPPANAGELGLIPESGRSPGEGMATHSSILAWRSPWTEESGRLKSMVSQSRT